VCRYTEGLSALLELAIGHVAVAAEEFCIEAPLPLRDDTVESAMDPFPRWLTEGGRGANADANQQPSPAAALDTVAEFLLDGEQLAQTWHAAAAPVLAALPTSDHAGLVARGGHAVHVECS
jgi:hypothetical protein